MSYYPKVPGTPKPQSRLSRAAGNMLQQKARLGQERLRKSPYEQRVAQMKRDAKRLA